MARTRSVSMAVLLAGGACSTFAGSVRGDHHYDTKMYDRVLERAAKLGETEVRTDVERLGASRDHDGATRQLLMCIDGLVDGLAWERQIAKGDMFDEQALWASVRAKEATYGSLGEYRRTEYEPDLRRLKDPEVAWRDNLETCVSTCGRLVERKIWDPLARDHALAAKYLARCKPALARAETAVQRKEQGDDLAQIQKNLALVEADGANGCFLQAHTWLASIDGQLAKMPPSDAVTAARGKHDELRARYADGLARAERHVQDPQVVSGKARLDALATDRELIDGHLAEVAKRIRATGATTMYDAYGGQTGHDGGDPQAHDRYVRERELWHTKRGQVDASAEAIRRELGALERTHGVGCD